MWSSKMLNIFKLPKNKISQTPIVVPLSRCSGTFKKDKPPPTDKQQKFINETWREAFETITKKPLLPINPESKIFTFFQTDIEMNPTGIRKFLRKKIVQNHKTLQAFIPDRHEILGSDLGAAHFLIYQGGKVRFQGFDRWFHLNEDKSTVDLPSKFDPDYVLVEIDASDITIFYEGLENFKNTTKVTRATFARSPLIDDWCMDRIAYTFPNLEYLNVSDCPMVSERGMEALYKLPNLKTLIITNHYKSAAFELTSMLLEDCIPGLKVEILEPKEKMIPSVNEL